MGSSIFILMRNGLRLNNLLSVKTSWIWHNIHVSYEFEVTCFMAQFLCFTLKHLMTSYIFTLKHLHNVMASYITRSFFSSKVVTAVVIVKVCWLNGQCDDLSRNFVTNIPGETVARVVATCSCLFGNALFFLP